MLRIEGWKANHKKVERIWREEGLQLPQRHRKRRRLYHKDSSIIRQALAVTVRTRMGAEDILEALYPLLLRHGTPEYIRSDNGPEFSAQAMQDWLARGGIKPIRI